MPGRISRFDDRKLPANQPTIARGEGFELVEIQEYRFAADKRNLVACCPRRLAQKGLVLEKAKRGAGEG